ncbi:MAG: hypothetical protein Q8R02_23390 [Hyphomonadaceae bacterium]|nr:hypothetical protein [Hyphomonadaceae bacterium]
MSGSKAVQDVSTTLAVWHAANNRLTVAIVRVRILDLLGDGLAGLLAGNIGGLRALHPLCGGFPSLRRPAYAYELQDGQQDGQSDGRADGDLPPQAGEEPHHIDTTSPERRFWM